MKNFSFNISTDKIAGLGHGIQTNLKFSVVDGPERQASDTRELVGNDEGGGTDDSTEVEETAVMQN